MACLSKLSYTKKGRLNRSRFVYKRCISFTKMASGVQNWRFVYKYAVFNLQTCISPYKLAPRITTQRTARSLLQYYLNPISFFHFRRLYANLFQLLKQWNCENWGFRCWFCFSSLLFYSGIAIIEFSAVVFASLACFSTAKLP